MAVEIIAGQITVEIGSLVGPQGPDGSISSINSISPNLPSFNIDIVADGASAITVLSDDPSDTITIGETHSPRTDNPHGVTAGQAGAEPEDPALQGHLINTSNPHGVTAVQAGAEPADPALQSHLVNTSNPHGVTAVQAGAEPADPAIQAHLIDTANPHAVTAAQAGADPAGSAAAVASDLGDHEADVANPHVVTAGQVGADPAGSAAAVASDLNDHELDVGNPHAVTAAQAGAEPANANIQGHIIDLTNPHVVTAVQVGATPIAHATDTANPHAVSAAQAGADPAGSAAAVASDLNDHEIDVANPHAVTAAQAGAEPADAAIQAHLIDTANPHGTTFTQAVTADAGTDISAAEAETLTDGSLADGLHTHAGVGGNSLQATWRFSTTTTDADPGSGNFRYDNAVPASVTELFIDNITRNGFNAFSILAALDTGAEIYIQQASNPLAFLLVTLTGPAVDNTGYFTLPVTIDDSGILPSNNQDCGFIVFTFGEPALAVHVADMANPHGVTAAQAGADPAGSAAVVAGALVTHESDVANPHAVTFTQAVAEDAGTDITPAEAEELTDGSETALHTHDPAEAAGPFTITGQWGYMAPGMDAKLKVHGTGMLGNVTEVSDANSHTINEFGVGAQLDSTAGAGNDVALSGGDADSIRLDQLPRVFHKVSLDDTTAVRFFVGYAPFASVPTDDNSLGGNEGVGLIYSSDRPDTNFQFVAHDGTVQTLVDSGIAVDTLIHHVSLFANSAASVTVKLFDEQGVEQASTTFTTELPAATVAMVPSQQLTTIGAAVRSLTHYSMSFLIP